jgi:hypothetical protein
MDQFSKIVKINDQNCNKSNLKGKKNFFLKKKEKKRSVRSRKAVDFGGYESAYKNIPF